MGKIQSHLPTKCKSKFKICMHKISQYVIYSHVLLFVRVTLVFTFTYFGTHSYKNGCWSYTLSSHTLHHGRSLGGQPSTPLLSPSVWLVSLNETSFEVNCIKFLFVLKSVEFKRTFERQLKGKMSRYIWQILKYDKQVSPPFIPIAYTVAEIKKKKT